MDDKSHFKRQQEMSTQICKLLYQFIHEGNRRGVFDGVRTTPPQKVFSHGNFFLRGTPLNLIKFNLEYKNFSAIKHEAENLIQVFNKLSRLIHL